MSEFHFLRPWWLLVLIPLFALLWWSWHAKRKYGAWQAVCDPVLMPFILEQWDKHTQSWHKWLLGLAGVMAIIALAGPAWQQLPQPVFRQQSAVVVLLDLSKSMDATDVSPSRLVRARLKILDLLNQLKEGQAALIAYAGDAFVVTPLTNDMDTIGALVPSLTTEIMPLQGSRPQLAIHAARNLLNQAGVRHGTVLLVTDGVDKSISTSIEELRSQGHQLFVMGVGTPDGAPIPDADQGFVKDQTGQIVIPKLQESVLRDVAAQGGGWYTRMRIDDDDIRHLLTPISQRESGSAARDTGLNTDRWREEGPWLLLFLLPIAMLTFRRGAMVIPLFLFLQWPDPLLAFEWDELWLNSNQLGQKAMEQENYKDAGKVFDDPQWKAAAYYRAGEFEQAVKQLEPIATPESHYNRGNALANLGNIPAAIKAYEETLRQVPTHEDAKYNLELLKQMQQQQQSSESENNKNEKQDQSQNQGQQSQNRQDGNSDNEPEQSRNSQQNQELNQSDQSDSQNQSANQERQLSEQNQEQQPQQESEQRKDQTQSAQSESERDTETNAHQSRTDEPEQPQTEEDLATAQWLRRIPDDPGGLLRRKFRYQYSRRYQDTAQPEQRW